MMKSSKKLCYLIVQSVSNVFVETLNVFTPAFITFFAFFLQAYVHDNRA